MSLAISIVSGGLDSVVMAHLLREEGHTLHLVSFDYGQRHKKELEYSRLCAQRLGAFHDMIDLRGVGAVLGGYHRCGARRRAAVAPAGAQTVFNPDAIRPTAALSTLPEGDYSAA